MSLIEKMAKIIEKRAKYDQLKEISDKFHSAALNIIEASSFINQLNADEKKIINQIKSLNKKEDIDSIGKKLLDISNELERYLNE